MFLLPGCVRFDGAFDFEADVLAGKKPLPVQFSLVVQGCTAASGASATGRSRERATRSTHEQAGSYTVILTVTPCGGESVSVRKDGYVAVTSGFGSAAPTMWRDYGDDEWHRIWRSEPVPLLDGQNPGPNEVPGHIAGVAHDFALQGTMRFWTHSAAKKIFAADVSPA